MTSYITTVGTCVPETRASQQDIANAVATSMQLDKRQKKLLNWIYRKSEIKYRHTVIKELSGENMHYKLDIDALTSGRMQAYEEHAKILANKVIQSIRHSADLSKITHLITVSCTGMYAPGLGIDIIHMLKLNHNIHRMAINFMGCYAGIPALRAADSICKADPNAVVLILDIELCTLHIKNDFNEDNLLSSALFADGVAAVIVKAKPSTSEISLRLDNFYSALIADEDRSMAWSIGDHGFDIRLSSYVPKLIAKGIDPLLVDLFRHYAITQNKIDYYAIHPGGKSILRTVEKNLNIDPEQSSASHEILENYGNMSSVSIFFVLKKIMSNVANEPHVGKILAMAFGPGLTLETMLLGVHFD